MTYPKTRITRSRSRSRNMRKKHLVKSKSKRINRSRKSKKTHSRKYRGGGLSAEEIEKVIKDIEKVIEDKNALTLRKYKTFPKVSDLTTRNIINDFLKDKESDPPLIELGTSYGGMRNHFLYRSPDKKYFLVTVSYDLNNKKLTNVYYFKPWMFAAIIVEEKGYQNEEERIKKEEQEEKRILAEGLFSTMGR
jgi:hypothetical protein